jgi:hypothetical protein
MNAPHAVYYDEEQKSLMSLVVINGVKFSSVLERANVVSPNGRLYTEDCLRAAAKEYMERLTPKRLHSEMDITVLS